MARGHLTVGVIIDAKLVRLSGERPEGGEYTFDMNVAEATKHIRDMTAAVDHITGNKTPLILPPSWQK